MVSAAGMDKMSEGRVRCGFGFAVCLGFETKINKKNKNIKIKKENQQINKLKIINRKYCTITHAARTRGAASASAASSRASRWPTRLLLIAIITNSYYY